MRKGFFGVFLAGVLSWSGVAVLGGDSEEFRFETRGYGPVEVRLSSGEGAGITEFRAESPEAARRLGSKRLADLLGFGDVVRAKAPVTAAAGTELARKRGEGCWLLGLRGEVFYELFARTPEGLKRLAERVGRLEPVPERAYPRYLDCFDNAGPGVWVGGGGQQYILPDDFEWLKQRKLAFCTLSPTQSRLVAPGVVDWSIFDWHSAMAKAYDLPYRQLLFPARMEWNWNVTPLPYARPVPGYIAYPWLGYQSNGVTGGEDPIPESDRYRWQLRGELARTLGKDDNLVGWHGCTEIPTAGINHLASLAETPAIQELWRDYLQNTLKLDLAAAGKRYRNDPAAFRSWEEIPMPTPIDFIGFKPDRSMVLNGEWEMLPDPEKIGQKAQWFDRSKAPAGWVKGDCSDPMIMINCARRGTREESQFWMRRKLQVTPEQLDHLKYLHIASAQYHGNMTPTFEVWINGKPLKALSAPNGYFSNCHEVGGALKAGENEIVLQTYGNAVPGYIFLGDTPLRLYPQMSQTENQLWFDGVNFSAALRLKKIKDDLASVRAVDPLRPLKLMATINLLDLTTPLSEQYGAYQHDTGGAGGYWAPMTGGRLARSHGLAWSCEQGGPPKDAATLQRSITYYLMYGNDAVDLVFGVGHYSQVPDVAKWFDENLNLIHCIGKLKLPTPPIGVLRSSRATRMGFAEPWNWDPARGTLQGVGRNFAYLEVPDVKTSVIDQFPVVMDAGTVLLTTDEVEAILDYVRRGGIFIAQHHTGRHLPDRADAWPLAAALGLKVTPKLINERNYHQWPLAAITFTADQELIPSLKGKTIEGSGVAIDYLNTHHTGAVGYTDGAERAVPVAKWNDGSMAVAEVHLGKGRVILLGTPFYTRMKDVNGIWANDNRRGELLDEMLTGLGVKRDSWTGNRQFWAELWRSKNGVYDLYPVARMENGKGEARPVTVRLRREQPVNEVIEISALDQPTLPVKCENGVLELPEQSYTPMQSRVFLALRADAERGALDWFRTQAEFWRVLPPVAPEKIGAPPPALDSVLPLGEEWRYCVNPDPELEKRFFESGFQPDAAWKSGRLGTFGAMGIPEKAKALFRRSVELPESWRGKTVTLTFDAEHWFWGLSPFARFWINGKPAELRQPILPASVPSFSLDVTEAAKSGKLELALLVDGSYVRPAKPGEKVIQAKPNGVSGLFYLQAEEEPVRVEPLTGPWFSAMAFQDLKPAKVGEKTRYVYLETKFELPETWPGKRLFLRSPVHLGWLVLNGQVISTPGWMRELEVTNLVRRDGVNVLRWTPASAGEPFHTRIHQQAIPALELCWRK